MLVQALPRDARYWLVLSEGGTRWTDTEHLLAVSTDALQYLAWLFARANFKDAPARPPAPLQRPGRRTIGATGLTDREMLARLKDQQQRLARR